jgi:hypothetical protein
MANMGGNLSFLGSFTLPPVQTKEGACSITNFMFFSQFEEVFYILKVVPEKRSPLPC